MIVPQFDSVNLIRKVCFNEIFLKRPHALLDLCDGILYAQTRCRCAGHVSLPGGTGHGGIYAALEKGEIDGPSLARVILEATKATGKLYAIDHTNILRQRARTSPRRKRLHQGGYRKGVHETKIGWSFSVLVKLTLKEDSFTIPVSVREVLPGEDIVKGVLGQLTELVKNSKATASNPDIVLFDAGFPAARLEDMIKKAALPVRIIVRLNLRQVFYGRPEKYRGAGRPRIHGERLSLKLPAVPPDAEISFPEEAFGSLRVRAWEKMHPKTPDIGVSEGTVLLIDARHLRRGMQRSQMALWTSGGARSGENALEVGGLKLVELLTTYLRRFDIEHLFRLWKHHLGLENYHPRTPEQFVRWVQCFMIVTLEAYLSKDEVSNILLPWERRKKISPLRALRGLTGAGQYLWSPPQMPKYPAPGPRRPRGKAKSRRKTFPVWRPGGDLVSVGG
jgi:DDE superfamily endonuclease